jgi:FkbM family methyltransferase
MNLQSPIAQLARSEYVRRVFAAVSRIPILGPLLRALARTALPTDVRLWVRIPAGLGKGLWSHLDPRFEMDYANGKYESRIQAVLASHLRAGSVFYDVGAHIGIVALFAAGLTGSEGEVFAFEADPENAKRIEEHAVRNSLPQIHVVSCAVWSSSGPLSFERASERSSRNQGSVTTGTVIPTENTVEINAVTLDEFSAGHRPPTLVKIDVEGAEAEVLRGAAKTFARAKPVLVCEVHGECAAKDVTRWLTEKGYSTEWLEPSPKFPRHLLATCRV